VNWQKQPVDQSTTVEGGVGRQRRKNDEEYAVYEQEALACSGVTK
jgi:hypothetical protein